MTTNGHNGMNENDQGSPDVSGCSEALDLLPLRAQNALEAREGRALQRHLSRCSDCAAEVAFLEEVVRARPEPPQGLKVAVLGRLRVDESGITEATPAGWGALVSAVRGSQRRVAGWGLSVAAMVVLALGIGILWSDGPTTEADGLITSVLLAAQEDEAEEWMVAGAPVLDGLPDEVLLSLMTEMD